MHMEAVDVRGRFPQTPGSCMRGITRASPPLILILSGVVVYLLAYQRRSELCLCTPSRLQSSVASMSVPARFAAREALRASLAFPYLSSARQVSKADAVALAQADARVLPEDAPAECKAWLLSSDLQSKFTSQFGQDAAVYYSFLAGKLAAGERGIYVDLGANKPRALSNTWFLDRCLGWHGLCIDADPALADALRASERTCTVLNMCAAGSRSTLSYVRDYGPDAAGGHVAMPGEKGDTLVPCAPLHEILREQGITRADFLSIDIEGNEILALANNNWDSVPIDIILVEAALNNDQLDMLLSDGGFWRVNDIAYIDDLYVRGPRLIKNEALDAVRIVAWLLLVVYIQFSSPT